MARPLTIAHPDAVRALMARLWLGERRSEPRHGSIVLRPHQRSALDRIRRMLHEHGGALLADDVGLGKTYVAAALARDYERVLVVAPATLRGMWQAALRSVGARASVVSYAMLSRGGGPRGPFDLVLLDEAHHARTPGTRRYVRLAELADRAHLLLLSATPIHNTRGDLAALLALFLGARALELDDDALAHHVLRRERGDVPTERMPETAPPVRLAVGDDAELLRAIVALPPALPLRDADSRRGASGDGSIALVAWGLAREWASSNAALVGALIRRLVRASALDAALDGGRLPSHRELAAWVCGDQAVQLALSGLFDEPLAGDGGDVLEVSNAGGIEELRSVVAVHEAAVRALLERAMASAWTDARRAQLLREIRARHPGEKIAAFTQFADTARALYRELRRDPGVAVLTARGASVAGGKLSRREAIERFAPRASGVRAPRSIERIDLLIATDLLSEGVNLHDASVVVHLDLPWTPARLEQRVGRSRRMGALHARTIVYALEPPASSEQLLGVERRLSAKLRSASRLLGATDAALLARAIHMRDGGETADATAQRGDERAEGAARRRELTARELEGWRDRAVHRNPPIRVSGVVAGIARAASDSLLALVREGGEHHLVAARGDEEVSSDPSLVLDVVLLATDANSDASDSGHHDAPLVFDPAVAVERVARWAARRAGVLAAGSTLESHAQVRKRALRRVAAIATRAPRHRRIEVTRLAALARQAAMAPYGVGAERALEELVAREMMSGEEWLRALGEFGASRGRDGGRSGAPQVEVLAILVLTAGSALES
jgi:superfamily II DNA or RNA helicase